MTSFRVVFARSFDRFALVPGSVRRALRERLGEVAQALEGVDDVGFWRSMEGARLRLDLEDWTFFYTAERAAREIRVTDAVPHGDAERASEQLRARAALRESEARERWSTARE